MGQGQSRFTSLSLCANVPPVRTLKVMGLLLVVLGIIIAWIGGFHVERSDIMGYVFVLIGLIALIFG